MEAFLAVSKGSESEPKLIVIRYKGNPDMPQEITGFIGKGITYDSRGYQLKPGDRLIQMKHDMADLANSGSKGAGAIVAGFFLKEFTENLAWVHVDIAGACWSDSISGINIQGGTGYGTRLLYELAKSLSK